MSEPASSGGPASSGWFASRQLVSEDFVADVQFDSDGLVVDYPGIATRIRTTSRIVAPDPSRTAPMPRTPGLSE